MQEVFSDVGGNQPFPMAGLRASGSGPRVPPTRVVILGGGIAGLSAAHELAKFYDDFEVHVFEKTGSLGGKAVSRETPQVRPPPGVDHHLYVAEHGFRLFPHFYRHVTQTMKEIPFSPYQMSFVKERPAGGDLEAKPGVRLANTEGSVWGNLIGSTEAASASGGVLRIVPRPFPYTGMDFIRMVRDTLGADDVATETDLAAYSWFLHKYMTSCRERREEEYERMSWLDFLGVGRGIYTQRFERLVRALPRTLQAMRPEIGSARTVGNITLQLFFDFTGDGGTHMESVLGGPTQETWLDPWVEYLKRRGVIFWKNSSVRGFEFDGLNVTGVHVDIEGPADQYRYPDRTRPEQFEWTLLDETCKTYKVTGRTKDDGGEKTDPGRQYYICALPLEVVQRLFQPPGAAPKGSPAPGAQNAAPDAGFVAGGQSRSVLEDARKKMLAFDRSLRQLTKIERAVLPMVGIQFYLNRDVPICNGHVLYPESPWALTSVSQAQFWEKLLPGQLADYLGVTGTGIDRFGTPQVQRIKGILSVIVSDWNTPAEPRQEFGPRDPSRDGVRGLRARDVTMAQLKREVWAQLKDALNAPGQRPVLDDWDLWPNLSDAEAKRLAEQMGKAPTAETYVDRLDALLSNAAVVDQSALGEPLLIARRGLPNGAIRPGTGHPFVPGDRLLNVFEPTRRDDDAPARGFTPLFVHPKGSYPVRPDAELRIPNLLLASDYVRTYTDLATMEGANEAAKRAVLAILRREEPSPESFPRLHPLSEGRLFEAAQAVDRILYNAGKQPHVMDTPQLLALLGGSVAQNVAQIGLDLLGVRRKPPPEMARTAAGFPPTTTAAVAATLRVVTTFTSAMAETVTKLTSKR
jgi:uncharacterized protein with NAD-binding domain and iron-sulfur cluster